MQFEFSRLLTNTFRYSVYRRIDVDVVSIRESVLEEILVIEESYDPFSSCNKHSRRRRRPMILESWSPASLAYER